MNKLPVVADEGWAVPRHAHIVVYEAEDGGELVTIYDCGVAQTPPSAQFRGHLVRIRVDRVISQSPTGYRIRLEEPGVLVEQGADHYVIQSRD